MRRAAGALIAIGCLLVTACVQRPPPIKSPMTATGSDAECTWSDGIDPNGNPSCSDGCTWDAAVKKCAPTPPPKKVDVPPNGT
ncbi:MAG: hypothetical protein U0441_12915 [Polyangiaceae bacterium]